MISGCLLFNVGWTHGKWDMTGKKQVNKKLVAKKKNAVFVFVVVFVFFYFHISLKSTGVQK